MSVSFSCVFRELFGFFIQGEAAQNYFVVDVGKCDVFVKRDVSSAKTALMNHFFISFCTVLSSF